METGTAEEQISSFSTAAFVPSNIRPSQFITFVDDNGDINIESIYNKSHHCTNVIAIRRRQYPLLSDSTESPPFNPEKMILRTRQRPFKPIEAAIKIVCSDPSLVSNININNSLIHKAVAITEDLLWCMLRIQASFYCQKQTIPDWSGFLISLKSSYNMT